MDGLDLTLLIAITEVLKKYNLDIIPHGDIIAIISPDKTRIAAFENIHDVSNFVMGYESGFKAGNLCSK
ncbi:MAG: hypothetical protein EOL93_01905 [Epsilonproteobacteria bacterium]|nr:hypothetical protein [Campylobacterota bacterium]